MSSASPVVSASAVSASETKAMKNIPQKYLKYMSYGLYLLKRICPHPEEYSARAIELLKLHNTVEDIVHDIDFILEGPLKTEMHEIQTIRKNFAKPPKKAKMAKDKPLVTLSQTCPLAAAIIECAQQSTVEHIVAISDSDRSDSDRESESDRETNAPVSAPTQKKLKKVAAVPAAAHVEQIVAAEQAVRNALADDKQKKEQEKKEQEKAKKEAEKALKEQEKEAEKLRKEQEKETEKLRKEQERAQKEQEKEAEKLRKEQEKLKKEQEKEAEKLRKEQEKLKKEAEKASKVKSIKPLTTELTAEPEK